MTAVIALWLALAAPAAAGEPPRYTLDNGLTVYLDPQPGGPSVAAVVAVRVVDLDETPETSGAAHMLEHMLFTETERWDRFEVKDVIESRGGDWNGLTNLERTLYYAHLSASELPTAVEWLSQVVFHPTLPADQLDREREVVFQERWGRYGWLVNTLDAWGFGYELDLAVRRALFPGWGLDQRTAGEDASLEEMSLATLRSFYERYYVPANAALVLSGGFDPDEASALIAEHFGALSAADPPPPRSPPDPGAGPSEVVVRGPLATDQSSLRVGARTAGLAHPDTPALEVLAQLMEKQLTEVLRYEQGLVYGISVWNTAFADTGYLTIKTRSEGRNLPEIQEEIDRQLAALAAGEVDPVKAEKARAAVIGVQALEHESSLAKARWLAEWLLVLSPDAPVPGLSDGLAAVTPDDVARVARDYLTPERRFSAVHEPAVTVATARWLAPLMIAMGFWLGLRRARSRRELRALRAERARSMAEGISPGG